jgi:hypothetical protein
MPTARIFYAPSSVEVPCLGPETPALPAAVTENDSSVQNAVVGLAATPWSQTANLSQLSPTLGVLTRVDAELLVVVRSLSRVENKVATPQTITHGATIDVVASQGLVQLAEATATKTYVSSLGAFDGTVDWTGASGVAEGPLTANGTDGPNLDVAPDLSPYVGGGLVTIDLDATGTPFADGPDTASLTTAEASCQLTLTYQFTRTLVRVTGQVWNDANGDGVFDASEAGIPGVELYLTDGEGTPIEGAARATTNECGQYTFDSIPVGAEYWVYVDTTTLPPGYDPIATAAPTSTTPPGLSLGITESGGTYEGQNFGFRVPVPTYTISGRVWIDDNADGVLDESETSGLYGLTLELRSSTNALLASTVADVDGSYTFAPQTVEDDVTVVLVGVPSEAFIPTYDPDGIGTPHQATVHATPGMDIAGFNFGYALAP